MAELTKSQAAEKAALLGELSLAYRHLARLHAAAFPLVLAGDLADTEYGELVAALKAAGDVLPVVKR